MILIPDNVLNYIPFEILTDENERHLLEEFEISYSGSARIFLELRNEFFAYDSEHNWVGFAPVYKEDRRLSSSEDEIRLIADRMDGDIYLGDQAVTDNFYEINRDYSVLHLAMHAEIDNNNPEYSKLIFADTILTSSEISLSQIRTNLAVLSACNTGFGKLEKGEGVMSMARAFHLSGVPSVVMSLWKVPDRETQKIMLYFYDHLLEGDSKSLALKKAKLDYLKETKDPVLRHPYYWAGFVINGNTQSLDVNKESTHIFVGISFLVLALMAGLAYAKKKGK
jgi:CHAT domain-containing protein